MNTKHKLFGALAVAGVIAASGSAFTGGGLSTTGQANGSQFVGGTVSQSITGAVLQSTAYTVSAGNTVTGILLTFDAAAAGKHVAATLGGVVYTCPDAIDADGAGPGTDTTSNCTDAVGGANTSSTLSVTVTQ